MAEKIARAEAARRGLENLSFRSAGIFASEGSPASEGARRMALAAGLSLEKHQASQVAPDLLAWADVVLAMGPGHLNALSTWVRTLDSGEASPRLTLLSTVALRGIEAPNAEDPGVPDPFGASDDVYRETWEALEAMLREALGRLQVDQEP